MKLLLTKEELDSLVIGNFLKPDFSNDANYLVTLQSVFGVVREISVSVEDKTSVSKSTKAEISNVPIDDDNGHTSVDDWIDGWRAAWKGKRVKAMGSRENCLSNMKEFFQLFPSHTKEHVFLARDKYLDSIGEDTRYLEQADYFIKKRISNGEGGVEVRRTLLIYCEEVILDEEFGTDTTFSIYKEI